MSAYAEDNQFLVSKEEMQFNTAKLYNKDFIGLSFKDFQTIMRQYQKQEEKKIFFDEPRGDQLLVELTPSIMHMVQLNSGVIPKFSLHQESGTIVEQFLKETGIKTPWIYMRMVQLVQHGKPVIQLGKYKEEVEEFFGKNHQSILVELNFNPDQLNEDSGRFSLSSGE